MTKKAKRQLRKGCGTEWPVGLSGPHRQLSVHLGQRIDELTIVVRVRHKKRDGSTKVIQELELPASLEKNLVRAIREAGAAIRSVPDLKGAKKLD